MAIFTSQGGYFQVESISFTPKVITMGEETSFEIEIKNVSGLNITKLIMNLCLHFKGKDGAFHRSNDVAVFGQLPLETSLGYWNNGKTVKFTGKFKLTSFYELDNAARVLPVYKAPDIGYDGEYDVGLALNIFTDVYFGGRYNTDQFMNLRGPNSEYLTVIDARYKPSIPVFTAERSNGDVLDDEGENLVSTIRLAKGEAAIPDRLKLLLQFQDKATPNGDVFQMNLTESLREPALAGKIITTFADTAGNYVKFDKDTNWRMILWFGDEYDSTAVEIEVPRSFANVHLSGKSTGGVCFGGFSKATEGHPLFQCYYPATFYKGIDGISRYSTDEVVIGRWLNGKRIYRRVFEGSVAAGDVKTFDAIPNMETLVGINGMMKWTASGTWVPLVYSAGNTTYNTVSADAEGRVSVTCTGAATCFVIIDYTKTGEEEEID